MGLKGWSARWPWAAGAASAALLAGAHAFERFGGLAPCILCLRQRETHWAVLAVAAVAIVAGLLAPRPAVRRLGAIALGIAFLVAAGWAGFHVGVELRWWDGPPACAAAGAKDLSAASIAEALGQPQKVVRCEDVTWSLLGISMAGWNGLISIALALASFTIAARDSARSKADV